MKKLLFFLLLLPLFANSQSLIQQIQANVPQPPLQSTLINMVDTMHTTSGTPGGTNHQIQFNNNGAFGGITNTTNQWLQSTGTGATPSFVTLNTDTSLRSKYINQVVFDVSNYGAVDDGVTDCTTAIQNAINAAYSFSLTHLGVGVVVYFPFKNKGIYLVNGTPQSIGTLPTMKAILYVPADSSLGNSVEMSIQGAQGQCQGQGDSAKQGIVIKTTRSDNTGTVCILGQKEYVTGSIYKASLSDLRVKNLTFAKRYNCGINSLDFGFCSQATCENVFCVWDTNQSLIENVTSVPRTSFGIRTPFCNNGDRIILDHCAVFGDNTGFILNENAVARLCHIRDCYVGYRVNPAFHDIHIDYCQSIHCAFDLLGSSVIDGVAGGATPTVAPFYATDFDIETITGTAFCATVKNVTDTNNKIEGRMNWHLVLGGSGVSNNFTKFNGNNLSTHQIISQTELLNNSTINGAWGVMNQNFSTGSGAYTEFGVKNDGSNLFHLFIDGAHLTSSGFDGANATGIYSTSPANNYKGMTFENTHANPIHFSIAGDTNMLIDFSGAICVGSASSHALIANNVGGWFNIVPSTGSRAQLGFVMGSKAPQTTGGMGVYANQNALRTWDSAGTNYALEGCIFTAEADGLDSNTVAETSILSSTGLGSLTLPAKFFTVGKTIHIVVKGYHNATANPNITIKVKLGSTVIGTTGAVASQNSTNSFFTVDFTMTCRTTGASGIIMGEGRYEEDNGATNDLLAGMANISGIAVNTTTTQAISVTATWGTASSSDVINGKLGYIEVKN